MEWGCRVEGERGVRVENKREEREDGMGERLRQGGGGEDNEGGGGDENRSDGNGIIAHIQDNISSVCLFAHVCIFAALQLCMFLLASEMVGFME